MNHWLERVIVFIEDDLVAKGTFLAFGNARKVPLFQLVQKNLKVLIIMLIYYVII